MMLTGGEKEKATENKPQSTSQCPAPVSGVYWLQYQQQLSLSQQFSSGDLQAHPERGSIPVEITAQDFSHHKDTQPSSRCAGHRVPAGTQG